MSMTFKTEAEFEQAFIATLMTKGWEHTVIKNPTEQDLLDNWANILFENNSGQDRLNGQRLTDTEPTRVFRRQFILSHATLADSSNRR